MFDLDYPAARLCCKFNPNSIIVSFYRARKTHRKPLLARRSEPYVAKEATMDELNSCLPRRSSREGG
jgi:hypothetical protein